VYQQQQSATSGVEYDGRCPAWNHDRHLFRRNRTALSVMPQPQIHDIAEPAKPTRHGRKVVPVDQDIGPTRVDDDGRPSDGVRHKLLRHATAGDHAIGIGR
jgi:hypothetical protein